MSCTYGGAATERRIVFRGLATGYSNGEDTPVINFRDNRNLTKVSGSLGKIFPTLQNNASPRFVGTFWECENLTDISGLSFKDITVGAKNMFWACYDKQTDKKLTVGVWDLDCTIGQNYTDKDPHPDVFGPEVDMRSQQMHLIDRMLSIPRYSQMVYDRYWELAERCLNADSLTARYEKYFLQFEKGGAAAREEARWSGDTDVAGLTLDLAAEFEFMSDWISRRFDYLNTVEFCRDNPTTGSKEYMGVVSDEPIYNLLGVAVQKPSGRGIYIQGGRKIFIVP